MPQTISLPEFSVEEKGELRVQIASASGVGKVLPQSGETALHTHIETGLLDPLIADSGS